MTASMNRPRLNKLVLDVKNERAANDAESQQTRRAAGNVQLLFNGTN